MVSPELIMSDSPRPSSVGSNQSTHSSVNLSLQKHGKGAGGDICVGEELKIAVGIALERFRLSEEQKELEFPSSLTSMERAYIHRLCQGLGLKSKSKGKGANRYLTVLKKSGSQVMQASAVFTLVRNSRHQVHTLLQRFPLTTKEHQDLQPRTERGQHNDGISKELTRTTTGRLNNGVPQIPPGRSESELALFRQSLPVYLMKDSIMQAINNNKIVLIAGETGSGKTTQVPQMILDQCEGTRKACRIFCTQPRRLSALSIAERVAAERGEKIGQTVGYQIRLESRVSPKTLLTFCTNGVLLRTLMGGDNSLSTDEVHERDRFSDFLLIAIRDILPRHKNLKLILMSASLNIQLFSSYFGGCPIINVPGKLFDVQEFFLEDILKMTHHTNKQMEKYKKELNLVGKQQKELETWCEHDITPHERSPPSGDTSSVDEVSHEMSRLTASDSIDMSDTDVNSHEPSPEKEDLEAWLIEDMDQLLGEAWLQGDEEVFTQIIHLILSEDVSVDYGHSQTSITPLMVAAGRGFYSTVEQLLGLGANVNVRASNDWTALDWARKFEQIEVLELLEAQMASTSDVRHDETLLVKHSHSLSDEDRLLLDIYHHCFDDEKVDLDLILNLVHKIHTSQQDGAILVFLPGYDEIVTLRDSIQEDKRFSDCNRYILYTLHSQMQSSDQRKVFKNPPAGVRKIVLSTNIAETSITINDVVFVIDSGKVKEKSFDALTSVSVLKSHWVSKASAQQRKGRAGRCRAGVCYHLFSRVRHDHMQEYQDPEILRYPLQELCLHTKLLAPINCPIADFLAKAPEPPAFLITRNAVHLLKQMDALDAYEDLTELGHHLADLPVEPRYAKMILYSVVLKCLDPVLTIACALAYKDPFVLPGAPYLKRAAVNIRRKFAGGTFSDHMSLLRAFQAWQKARTEGWEKSFCSKNFLSGATMEMLVGTRTQLLGQLRASGFVRARGGGDIRDLNTNSENWAVVKAALCAGLYPNLIRVDRQRKQLLTMKENKIRIHNSSVLNAPATEEYQVRNNKSTHNSTVTNLPTDWMVYEEITRAHRLAQVRCCTLVSPITVAIFGGPAKLPYESVREAEGMGRQGCHGDSHMDASSDSEGEEKEDGKMTSFRLDDWLSFKIDTEASNLLMQLRQKWHSLFIRRMRAPAKPWSQVDENVIRTVVGVLTNEEQALGLQQPAGIGQRPRPMATDNIISSGGSRRGSYDTEHSDDSSNTSGTDLKQTPTRSRPFKFQTTPPRRKDLPYYSRSSEDQSETSSVKSGGSGPGSANDSGANSLRGSAASSPCSSPQLPPTGKPDSDSVRYFVMKSANYKNLDISWQRGIWAATPSNERKLTAAFKDCKAVYMIFSVHGSGHFQGYAKMMSTIGNERCRELTGNNLGNVFTIEWIKRSNLPFQQAHHLVNPWNEGRRVQISRDGQEIEPSTGESLLHLWDTLPQARAPTQNTRYSPQDSHKGPDSPRGYGNKGYRGDQWGNQQPGGYKQKAQWVGGRGQGYLGPSPTSNAAQTTLTSVMASPQISSQMTPPYSPVYMTQVMPHQGGGQMGSKNQNPYPSPQSPAHTMSPVMILQRGMTAPGSTTATTTSTNAGGGRPQPRY